LKQELSKDGEFDNVKALVVVSPIPLIFLNSQLASLFQEAKDHWAFGKYKQEQIQILQLLQQYVSLNTNPHPIDGKTQIHNEMSFSSAEM
jgi:hypothetical protein